MTLMSSYVLHKPMNRNVKAWNRMFAVFADGPGYCVFCVRIGCRKGNLRGCISFSGQSAGRCTSCLRAVKRIEKAKLSFAA